MSLKFTKAEAGPPPALPGKETSAICIARHERNIFYCGRYNYTAGDWDFFDGEYPVYPGKITHYCIVEPFDESLWEATSTGALPPPRGELRYDSVYCLICVDFGQPFAEAVYVYKDNDWVAFNRLIPGAHVSHYWVIDQNQFVP